MVRKKMTLWKKIRFYHLIPLSLIAVIMILIRNYAVAGFISLIKIQKTHFLYKWTPYAIYLLLFSIWSFITVSIIKDRRYFYKTGRNYNHDKSRYWPMRYGELLDYFKDADPHRLDTSDFPVMDWKQAKGITFGYDPKKRLVMIPSNCEANIAVFGPPGSWKTSGFAIPVARTFEGSVLAIDIKGDIYNYCKNHRKIVKFSPDGDDDLKESWHFNPLAGINEMDITDRKLFIESMAIILIPEEEESEGKYFTTRARKFFQGIVHRLLAQNPKITFPEIVHSILEGNCIDWVMMEKEGPSCREATELLSPFYGSNEKNVSGAYDNLCTAMSPFSSPVLDELLVDNGKCISIDTLESGTDIYLSIKQEHLDNYASLFTLIIESFSTAFTKRPDTSTAKGRKNRQILLLLDEFPALTYSYKQINKNLSLLRSKSVVCCIIQQNLAQLHIRYKKDGARSILANCTYKVILGSDEIESSKYFSETIGRHKILRVSKSVSSSDKESQGKSIVQCDEPVFFPEDFGDLGDKMVVYFHGKYCTLTKKSCYSPQEEKGDPK